MNKAYIPTLPGLEFRRVDDTLAARHHRGHLGTEWQLNLLLPHQDPKAVYLQKIERGDPFRFCFDATENLSVTLKVIDCDGTEIEDLGAPTAEDDVPGNVAADNSQFHSYLWRLDDLSAITADGQYYFVLTVDFDSVTIRQYISHPVWIKDTHEDTMLIEYRHSENIKRVNFEQLPALYRFRVDAFIGRVIAKSTATVYEGQQQTLEQLDRTAYQEFPLYVGERDPIPEWVLNKLNHIFDCDTVYLDGKQYRAADGASFENNGTEESPLFATSINLRTPDNSTGLDDGDGTVALFNVPAYPFAIHSVLIGKSTAYITVSSTAIIEDAAALTAWLTAVNTGLDAQELTGSVQNTGGLIEYVLGDGENYDTASAVVYPTVAFTYDITLAGAGTRGFDLAKGSLVVDWGEGDPVRADVSSFSPTTFSHAYAGAGTYTVRLFGSNVHTFLEDGADVSDFDGLLPSNLVVLTVDGATWASDTLDADLFAPCALTLQELTITDGAIDTLLNFNTVAHSFPALRFVDMSGNALPTAAYNFLIKYIAQNANNNSITGGTLSLVGQSTSPTLNANGLSGLSTLSSLSWTVNL